LKTSNWDFTPRKVYTYGSAFVTIPGKVDKPRYDTSQPSFLQKVLDMSEGDI